MIHNFINQIHQQHIRKNFYELEINHNIHPTSPKKCQDPLLTVERIIKLSKSKECNTKEKQILQSCAYDYLRWIKKNNLIDENTFDRYNKLSAETFINLLGKEPTDELLQKILPEIQNATPWYQFIKSNRIHYAVHGQQLNYHDDIVGKICINGEWHDFNKLEIKENGSGYQFLLGSRMFFSTDKQFRLKDFFYGGNLGVLPGTAVNANGIENFFTRPSTGKCWLSVYTSTKNPLQVQFGQSHSYLGLENTEGNFFYAGQYGLEEDMNGCDAFSPFGNKKMGIETPDRYSSIPLALHRITEARIEITREQYETLLASIKKDKEKGVQGSLIKGNCTEYVRKKLRLIGIQAKTTMTGQEYLTRLGLQVFPRKISNKVVQLGKSLPSWAKKVAHFNPFIYPVVITLSIVISLLSGKLKSDVSILHAVTRPWNIKVSHPIALCEWLDQFQKEQENYSILRTGVHDKSLIGGVSNTLGFNMDEEAKLLVKSKVHITQHKPLPLPVLICKVIYDAIVHNLSNWLGSKNEMDKNTILLYLHTLMNQKFISPYQFYNLRESINDKDEFKTQVMSLLESLHLKKLIDRRSYIYLKKQIKDGIINEPLQYIISVALLGGVNKTEHLSTVEQLISPEIQMEINRHIRQYQSQYFFSVTAVRTIQAFVSRVNCYEWVQKIDDKESKEEISEAIKARDEKQFIKALRYYFSKRIKNKEISVIEKQILKEMMHSVEFPKGESAFVNFSHDIQTQARILEVENELKQLRERITELSDRITNNDLEALKQLHQNIGVFINSHIAYTGSATFVSAMIGKVRYEWEAIDDLLRNRVMPSASEVDFWPDIGFREIKPMPVEKLGDNVPFVPSKRKKVFFAYCSWGSGHKTVARALAGALKDNYRMSACDIPDEILIERDPLFQSLGPQHSITTVYNTLVAGNYWGAINLIKKMTSAPTPQEEVAAKKELIIRKLMQEKPDVVVACYERHSNLLLEAAKELGIPFIQVYTDMIQDIADNVKDAFNQSDQYQHQRILCPYPIEEMKACIQKSGIDSSQCKYMGFPVRKEFSEKHNIEELKLKYDVKPNQKVILCMNGGCSGSTPWPKIIAGAKKGSLQNIKLIVICGNNKHFYNEVKKLKVIDPSIEVEARSYTQAKEMAEITAIADLTISKPGGASVAENILLKNYLLLDTRFSGSLQWEKDAANALIKYGLAREITSERNFIDVLKEALKKKVSSVDTFHQYDGIVEQTFIEEIENMMNAASNDSEILEKRDEVHTLENVYPTMDLYRPSHENFEQNLAAFLLLNEKLNPKKIVPSLKSTIWKATDKDLFIRFNLSSSKFEVCSNLEIKDLEYAVNVMIREVKSGREVSYEDLERIVQLIEKARKLNKNAVHPIIKRLAYIDFQRTSKVLRLKDSQPETIEQIKEKFLTEEAYRELFSWVELQTSKSRKNPLKNGDQRMISEPELLKVYIHHPEELEFVKVLFLHRKASAFNHVFKADNNHHLCIKFQGEPTPVSELMNQFKLVNDRIISVQNNNEYTYTEQLGLCKIIKGQHPVRWRNAIPVFKIKKDRKTKDYRLEIMSVTGKENHGWLRLKDPEGNIYSLGTFWDPDYLLRNIQRFDTFPGYVRAAGDLQEFLGQEKFWKRTKIELDKDKFNQLKQHIIRKQKQGIQYNLANGNCVSFVREILKEIGIKYKVASSSLIIYTMPKSVRRFLIRHNQIRKIVESVTYPLRLIENTILSAFGMWSKRDIEEKGESGFNSAYEFFAWGKGGVDHPEQLRLIQEVIEKDYALTETDKVHYSRFQETVKTSLAGSILQVSTNNT